MNCLMLEFKLVSKAHKYYHLLPWQFTTHPRKVVFPSRANMIHALQAADGISSLQFCVLHCTEPNSYLEANVSASVSDHIVASC